MDYEQKYNEAVMRADEAVQKGCLDKGIFDTIFPELRESEDERIRKALIEYFNEPGIAFNEVDGVCTDKVLAWLEKQKEQKPVEWSEEDEKNIYFLTRLIELYIKDGRYETGDGTVTKPEIIKMLKSLRPSWKPSGEQMVMLRAVINDPNNAGAEGCQLALRELYEQLKRL